METGPAEATTSDPQQMTLQFVSSDGRYILFNFTAAAGFSQHLANGA